MHNSGSAYLFTYLSICSLSVSLFIPILSSKISAHCWKRNNKNPRNFGKLAGSLKIQGWEGRVVRGLPRNIAFKLPYIITKLLPIFIFDIFNNFKRG